MNTLCTDNLAQVAPTVQRPRYDRRQLQTGILHLGLGAFHRAHQALYTDAVINQTGDLRWGIAGVSLRSREVSDRLLPQDLLYSVVERHSEAQARVVGSLTAAWHAPSQMALVLQAIANPAVQVITLTVTEKAYGGLPASGELDRTHAELAADLAGRQPAQSVLGVLCAGLAQRPLDAKLNVVCCDNMNRNGEVLRQLLIQYARQMAPGLAARIDDQMAFPNTMVDRIVPAATAESLQWASQHLGLQDRAAIVCEPFSQWVIENRFVAAHPDWAAAGALMVNDVAPYQDLKLRLLNATHSAMAYWGQLAGMATVGEVMCNAPLSALVRELLMIDLLSVTPVPPGFDVQAYGRDLLHRFENTALAHRTEQIAMDGTQKVAVRWLPSLRTSLERRRPLPRLEFALAAWLHYLDRATDDRGTPLVVSDPGAAPLQLALRAAQSAKDKVLAACAHEAVLGPNQWPPEWTERMACALGRLQDQGMRLQPTQVSVIAK